ncbi:MAG: diguanylate cyclase [Sphingomonadales bacterium]
MELQAVTASAAVGITRVVIALFMFGLYLAARRDACTGYWAVSAVLTGVGSTTPLYGETAGSLGMWFACVSVVTGGVMYWWGLRLFFGRDRSPLGWWMIGGVALVTGVMFLLTSAQQPRLLAFAGAVLVGIAVIVREAWRGDGSPLSVGRAMVVGSYSFVLVVLLARAGYFLIGGVPVSPTSDHPVNVTLLYLVPLLTSTLAAVGSLLMYFQRTVAQKEHLATHDDLTRIFNRRALAAAGRQALASGPGEVAVLLIDVDHFKSINDSLGHMAGDAVLTSIADTLARNCRADDIIGRQGGEEFCIVCSNTRPAEAAALAERLLAAVAAIPRPPGLAEPLSVSVGIAAGQADPDWDAALRYADGALYAAKAAGRGQAVTA